MKNFEVEIIFLVAAIVAVTFLQRWRTKNYDYKCGKCGERFTLPLWKAVLAPHSMGRKLVKCPKCGRRGWAAPVPKEPD